MSRTCSRDLAWLSHLCPRTDAAPIPAGQGLPVPSRAHSQRRHTGLRHRLSAIYLPDRKSTLSPRCDRLVLFHYAYSGNDNPLAGGWIHYVFCLRILISPGASKQQSDRAPLPPTTVMCYSLSCCRPQDTCHNTHNHWEDLAASLSGSSLLSRRIPISCPAVEHRP